MQRAGLTLTELLIVVGLIMVFALASLLLLSGRRGTSNLDSVTTRTVTLLREAQQRAIAQDDGSPWGIHFDATEDGRGSISLFASSTFGAGVPVVEQFRLPNNVKISTSTVPEMGGLDVVFDLRTGEVATSTEIGFVLIAPPFSTSSVSISTLGTVTQE